MGRPTRHSSRHAGQPYDQLDMLVKMLGGIAPVDAIRVFRENTTLENIPALRGFDPDRAERSLELLPDAGRSRPAGSVADWFRERLGVPRQNTPRNEDK